jgi:NAD(P)-dependent dehydrogenase (short-subunit alcohol dehydrogenase family)/glyoxylase-like metal-dependent hydrolase (beta-lactamase superfamily II)
MPGIPFIKDFKFDYGTAMEVTPLIRRVVARNPSPFTFKGTGTYVIGHGKVAIVDPGPDQPDHIDAVLNAVRGETVTHILVTHTHIDHVPATPAMAKATGAKVYSYGPHPKPPAGVRPSRKAISPSPRHQAQRRRRGARRRLERRGGLHAGPHLQPSLLSREGDNALLSGDHVMGWSTAVISPPDGNMADYFASLRKLLPRSERSTSRRTVRRSAIRILRRGLHRASPWPRGADHGAAQGGPADRSADGCEELRRHADPSARGRRPLDAGASHPDGEGRPHQDRGRAGPDRLDVSTLSKDPSLKRGDPSLQRRRDTTMDLKLTGKTVLITGGSRGIGFACAMAFAAEGCAVHIASRSQESLEAARDKIRARHNVPVEIHAADFSKGDTVRGVVEAVGHADILVNNAGAIPRGDIFAMTEAKWREAWELKMFGYVNATRAMLEKMYTRKKGVVVNIIGLAGESFNYDYVAGTTANAGLMAFTRAVGSKSVDQGVRVVAINPPGTRTDRMTTLLRSQAQQQWGDPERWPDSPSTCRSAGRPSPTRWPTSRCSSPRSARATSAAW